MSAARLSIARSVVSAAFGRWSEKLVRSAELIFLPPASSVTLCLNAARRDVISASRCSSSRALRKLRTR